MSYSVALDGVDGRVVVVEADVSDGVPGWSLSGLADLCVSEARDRCRAAVINSGQKWPDRKITVAMYPADVPKVGSHYDLAIALALLIAKGEVPQGPLASAVVFGELGLNGRLRPVPGVLPAALAAVRAGLSRAIVPIGNVAEAQLVPGLEVVGVSSLVECMAVLRGEEPPPDGPVLDDYGLTPGAAPAAAEETDLADVRGQARARWCVEVAAAGGHHLFLEGPPGAGKTMLAERLPRLLPDLDLVASIEVSKVHSVAGLLARDDPLVVRPPFLAPNHTDTVPSVVGGGSRVIRPGAISLAHLGVLFLDEAPEFRPSVHDALRQPLESGEISIRRADGAARFPARFQLILAANPCPCGRSHHRRGCECPPSLKRRYQAKISGPVRDRIDIVHTVLPVSRAEMRQPVGAEHCTAAVAARVRDARLRQQARLTGLAATVNARVPMPELRRRCPLGPEPSGLVEDAVAEGRLTQRGADRVVRLAWTVADLAGRRTPSVADMVEALRLRSDGLLGAGGASRWSA
ncbi:MAG TPA: YifB family Mg chelatase-like AAA ATPase [Nocardioidaceae bacterium]|nr:YifB family Mg chelatase-like AAA ATPase [Nocardioidaceae bacterium]